MRKSIVAVVTAITFAVVGAAYAAPPKGGGPQGGGPGGSGAGDKASKFAGPGPGNSFKTGSSSHKFNASGPQGGGPGNSGTGDKNSNRNGVRLP
jgi:hypothetical protein